MQLPRDGEGLASLTDRLTYHEAALDAAGVLPEALPSVRALAAKAEDLRTRRAQARKEALRRSFARQRADSACDRAIKQLEAELFAAVGRRREDERYQACFGQLSMGALVRLPYAEEAVGARGLASALEGVGLEEVRAKHQADLRAKADQLEAADQAHEAALRVELGLALDLKMLRQQLSRLLERNYADLLALFPHDKQEVEGFFLRPQTQRSRAEEDDGEG